MLITRVKLNGFMRYDNVDLALHPGFTAITGPTDAGKSTIIRALTWVLFNTPSGDGMIRQGQDEARVELWTDTGHHVVRYKGKRRNGYELDGQPFESVGTSVPKDIQEALGVHVAILGPKVEEQLGISGQLDAPFMLGDSGGNAARILGNLSGITTIDQALSGLKPDINAARRDIEVAEKTLAGYEVSIKEFENLLAREGHLRQVRTALDRAETISERIAKLQALAEHMEEFNAMVGTVDRALELLADRLQAAAPLGQARGLCTRIEQLHALTTAMVELNASWNQTVADEQGVQEELVRVERERLQTLHDAGFCPLCGQATAKES